jgi:hypothetical protein
MIGAEAHRRGEAPPTNRELAAWLAWAERYADNLDPLAHGSPLPRYADMQAAAAVQETSGHGFQDDGA